MSSSVTTKDELMAEVENETRQLKKKEFFPYKIMGTLIFSLLLSIVIEWGAWIYHYLRDYIESVLYVIITFIIRLMIIVLISPLFLLVVLVGGRWIGSARFTSFRCGA